MKPQPERQPPVPAAKTPTSPGDTNRPTDSVPVQTGSFAKLPLRFGRYQVEKLLGKGAMGAVYLARDTQLDRLVALKIPKLSASAKGSEKLLKRLKTEAMAAAQIDHPSVCPVFDSGDIDGVPYIAMQYVEGETLKDHLKNQAKTPQPAVALILQLAEGLAEAHSHKIYHRDLKPENIKLNKRGVPVIMDFGLAKLATTFRSDASATQAGTTLGTPAYMSPEQASGKVEAIDHRSDIYALGVMLYEMLTGQWPFTGAAIEVMGQKSVLEPPSPLTVKPELDPQLAAVCHKLIARKREDRYQDAQELIAALSALNMGSGTQGTGSSIPEAQSHSGIATRRPSFEENDTLSSEIARRKQNANRSVAGATQDGKTRPITQPVANWWHGRPRGVKWTVLAAGVLVLGLIGLLATGVFTKVKTKEGTLVTLKEGNQEVSKLKLESVDTLPQEQPAPPPGNAPTTPVAPLPSSDLDRVATGKWVRLVDSKTVLSDRQKMRFRNGILELDSTKMEFPKINARDVIIRAKVRKVSGQNLGIRLRCGSQHYGAWFAGHDQLGGDFFGIGKAAKPWVDLTTAHIGRKFRPGEFVEMAFAAIGDTLTLYIDGTKTVTVTNNDLASGFVSFSALKGKGLFKDVEYQSLDPVPLEPKQGPEQVVDGQESQEKLEADAEPIQYGIKNGDFSSGLNGWEAEDGGANFLVFKWKSGKFMALSTYGPGAGRREAITGRLFQKSTIPQDADKLEFFVHGGKGPALYIALTHKDRTHFRVTGRSDNSRFRVAWDISPLRGEIVTLEIVDRSTGPWGFIGADGFRIIKGAQ